MSLFKSLMVCCLIIQLIECDETSEPDENAEFLNKACKKACKHGQYCNTKSGKCQKLGLKYKEDPCFEDNECRSNKCENSKCGDFCERDDWCRPRLEFCDNKECQLKRNDGESCTAPSNCKSNKCVRQKCITGRNYLQDGQTCSKSIQCESNDCTNKKCRRLKNKGEPCQFNSDCYTNFCFKDTSEDIIEGICKNKKDN